jgi:hypothetical protein
MSSLPCGEGGQRNHHTVAVVRIVVSNRIVDGGLEGSIADAKQNGYRVIV